MRKTFLFLFLLPLCSFAQDIEIPVKPVNLNEIGINLFSITRLETYRDYLDRNEVSACFNAVPGIYYKRHFGQNALRASFDYTRKSMKYGDANSGEYLSLYMSAVRKNIGINIGYERSFFKGKFQPYVFSDLVFNYENLTGERAEYGCFGSSGIFPFAEETLEYGVSAGGGLRYSITPRFHLSCEFAAQGVISVFDDLTYPGYKYTSREYHLNPLNKLGFAVSF